MDQNTVNNLDRQLFNAIISENYKEVARLLERGANPNRLHPAHGGVSAFHIAVGLDNSLAYTELFLKHKARVNLKSLKDEWTPLHVCACWNKSDSLRTLLLNGADPFQLDTNGNTAILIAEENGSSACSKILAEFMHNTNWHHRARLTTPTRNQQQQNQPQQPNSELSRTNSASSMNSLGDVSSLSFSHMRTSTFDDETLFEKQLAAESCRNFDHNSLMRRPKPQSDHKATIKAASPLSSNNRKTAPPPPSLPPPPPPTQAPPILPHRQTHANTEQHSSQSQLSLTNTQDLEEMISAIIELKLEQQQKQQQQLQQNRSPASNNNPSRIIPPDESIDLRHKPSPSQQKRNLDVSRPPACLLLPSKSPLTSSSRSTIINGGGSVSSSSQTKITSTRFLTPEHHHHHQHHHVSSSGTVPFKSNLVSEVVIQGQKIHRETQTTGRMVKLTASSGNVDSTLSSAQPLPAQLLEELSNRLGSQREKLHRNTLTDTNTQVKTTKVSSLKASNSTTSSPPPPPPPPPPLPPPSSSSARLSKSPNNSSLNGRIRNWLNSRLSGSFLIPPPSPPLATENTETNQRRVRRDSNTSGKFTLGLANRLKSTSVGSLLFPNKASSPQNSRTPKQRTASSTNATVSAQITRSARASSLTARTRKQQQQNRSPATQHKPVIRQKNLAPLPPSSSSGVYSYSPRKATAAAQGSPASVRSALYSNAAVRARNQHHQQQVQPSQPTTPKNNTAQQLNSSQVNRSGEKIPFDQIGQNFFRSVFGSTTSPRQTPPKQTASSSMPDNSRVNRSGEKISFDQLGQKYFHSVFGSGSGGDPVMSPGLLPVTRAGLNSPSSNAYRHNEVPMCNDGQLITDDETADKYQRNGLDYDSDRTLYDADDQLTNDEDNYGQEEQRGHVIPIEREANYQSNNKTYATFKTAEDNLNDYLHMLTMHSNESRRRISTNRSVQEIEENKENNVSLTRRDLEINYGFSSELCDQICGQLDLTTASDIIVSNMFTCFEQTNPEVKWREGNVKSAFNYLLLDPRITRNLPVRAKQQKPPMSESDVLRTFCAAVFYVGKGSRARPYAHLHDSLVYWNKQYAQAKLGQEVADEQAKKSIIKKIVSVWNDKLGVVSLHCFQSVIPSEAYTREAAMIDALGMKHLTNMKKGNYYGETQRWSAQKKRQLGVILLRRACSIFMAEGERQISPYDLIK